MKILTLATDLRHNWYHGSPNSNLILSSQTLYLTKNYAVAEAYALGKVAGASKPFRNSVKGPCVYKFDLINSCALFDLRRADCKDLYATTRLVLNKTEEYQDYPLPKLTSIGFINSHTGLQGYGITPLIKQAFGDIYDAAFVDEGQQGISLAVFLPKRTLRWLQK